MKKEYQTSYSQFFFIQGIAVEQINLKWQNISIGDEGLLCLENLPNPLEKNILLASITIGCKHANGDGLNCQITVDKIKAEVSFESDIASGIPVFWLACDEVIIIASGIELLISLAKECGIKLCPNLNALSELLVAGYIFTEMQTAVQGVQLLPPRSKLIINTKSRTLKIKKTAPDFAYTDETMTWQDAKNTFKDNLITGFQRFRGKRVACLLSGGADSRIVAVSAVKSGIDVNFFTFGQSTINVSDFYVANQVAYRLGKKTNCFSTSAEAFIKNWKSSCSDANWINDSVWWAGRIRREMFAQLQGYDVIIRGDGDGIYGWKTAVAGVSDMLHRLEISPMAATKSAWKYFRDPQAVFNPAQISRNHLVDKYRNTNETPRDLMNMLYQKIREPRGIVPGVWHFSRLTAVDSPLLWQKLLWVAGKLPKNKRCDKKIIFEVLKTFDQTKDVPFSSAASWDNQLEFYYTGVWEELIDYIARHLPWEIYKNKISDDFLRPSETHYRLRYRRRIYDKMKKHLLATTLGRKAAFRYFQRLAGCGLSERLIIRLALISNLCDVLNRKKTKMIVSTNMEALTL